MNTKRVDAAAGVLLAVLKQGKTLPVSWAYALESACLLQSPESADELVVLRRRVAELETCTPRLRTDELTTGNRVVDWKSMTRFTIDSVTLSETDWRFCPPDRKSASESGMEVIGHDAAGETVRFTAAQSYLWDRDMEAERTALMAEVDRLRARVAELEAERHSTNEALADVTVAGRAAESTVSPWQRAVDGLNALVDAGIGFHIEPDGHISHPFGGEHIEWDHGAERWRLVYDDEETERAESVARLRALLAGKAGDPS